MAGKIIKFDSETLAAVELLAKDKSGTFQEIADEAFADLLKKYHRPATLIGALKESVKHPDDSFGKKRTRRRRASNRHRQKAHSAQEQASR
jgi:hypothetical protein